MNSTGKPMAHTTRTPPMGRMSPAKHEETAATTTNTTRRLDHRIRYCYTLFRGRAKTAESGFSVRALMH